MNKPAAKKRRKKFAKEERAIRRIINEWGPIGFPSPEDEYDTLVHDLLSVLHSGGSDEAMVARLIAELEDYVPVPVSENEICDIADRVWDCWKSEIIHL